MEEETFRATVRGGKAFRHRAYVLSRNAHNRKLRDQRKKKLINGTFKALAITANQI